MSSHPPCSIRQAFPEDERLWLSMPGCVQTRIPLCIRGGTGVLFQGPDAVPTPGAAGAAPFLEIFQFCPWIWELQRVFWRRDNSWAHSCGH